MQKSFMRICSLLLILVLLFNMLPMSVFAQEFRESIQSSDSTAQTTETVTAEDAYVVDEIVENRTEYTKEFVLSNGLHMATIYPDAVHYEKDGAWEEIDNTLVAKANGVLSNTAGVWEVSFPQQLTKDKSITIEKDGYTLSFFLAGELTQGLEVPVMPVEPVEQATLPAETEAELAATVPEAAAGTVSETTGETVPETTGETIPETVPETTAQTVPAETVPELTAAATEETALLPSTEALAEITVDGKVEKFGLSQLQQSAAAVQPVDLESMRQSLSHEEMVPEKNRSRLRYDDVYQSTDIVYDLDANKVKESIVLESYRDSLRGYRYTLSVGDMLPVLEEDGSITFYDKTGENVVMVMPAPYLVDDAGTYNSDIRVQLTGSGSSYTMTYLLPQQWLGAEDRAWPVILDPIIFADLDIKNIRDKTVAENSDFTDSNMQGMLHVGYTVHGVAHTYLMYNNLPALTSSDVIVGATISLYKPEVSSKITPIEVHKVTEAWPDTYGWADKPDFNASVEDYAIVDEVGPYSWTITDIVRDWYTNGNTGMMFKTTNSIEQAQEQNFKKFYSSDYSDYNSSKPVLMISFRNNNGLENYWDYTATSAGRAGTGYVNNFAGNLVWVRENIGFGGNRMPVAISHVYNLNDTRDPDPSGENNNSNDTSGNFLGMGVGWRTNFHQEIYRWKINQVDKGYYIWEDADGTDHYFELKDGKYKDEDGLEMTITDTGSGNKKYTLEDKNGNVSYFDTHYRLYQQVNNQATKSTITVEYISESSYKIASVTDGIGRKYTFTYNSANTLLQSISCTGTDGSALGTVSYGYNDKLQLVSITDMDGEVCRYTYDSNGNLLSAQDIDGYTVNYTYNTVTESYQPYRVLSVTETHGTAQGGALSFAYAHNQTTITDHSGNVEILQFNDFGNTICIQDDEGHAQFAEFAFNTDEEKDNNANTSAKGNQLTLSSKLQNTVANLLKDHSFESANPWTAHYDVTASRSTDEAYLGSYSLKIASSANRRGVYSQMFTVASGETVTFSAYVKSGAKYQLMLQRETTPGTYVNHEGEFVSSEDGWVRQELSYTNDTDQTLNMWAFLRSEGAGTFYMDCVQVQITPTASRYNLLENGDFGFTGSPAYGWSGSGLNSTDRIVQDPRTATPNLNNAVFSITGSPTGEKHISQTLQWSGSAGDCFVFSGWAWADNAVPEYNWQDEDDPREFNITLTVAYTDGETGTTTAKFNPGCSSWQYTAAAFAAEKDYTELTVTIRYDHNANVVWFDGIQLYKEEFGSSYTYEETEDGGEIISVKDLQGKITKYEYDSSNDLTKVILSTGAEMTYTYDDYHNVKTSTTAEGLMYSFTYDTYGNNTSVSIAVDGKTMTGRANYSDNGNCLEYTEDDLGKKTYYGYNQQTNVLEWIQYPEDTDGTEGTADTRTKYTYDTMHRMASATCTTDTGLNMSASYTYTDDLLTSIQTPSTTYSFTYGDFGLRSSVKVGTRTLAAYSYTEDKNNYLETLAYTNGDSVQYEYDIKGRVTKQTYEDGDTVSYSYDNNGALATVTDSATGISTTYYYDLTDRMMKYVESGNDYSHSVAYEYDDINNLTELVETINGQKHTTSYAYDEDNRVTSVTAGSFTETYSYDDYGRVNQKQTTDGETVVKTETYTFHSPSEATDSTQVSTYKTEGTGLIAEFAYTYDDNGNLLSVSEGVQNLVARANTSGNETTYTYDSANQLLRENNRSADKTWTWTYDEAGNILSRTEYAYTTGTLGEPIDTVTYHYGAVQWGDMLTMYDGIALGYDNVGNLIYDGTWDYTWEHGRQLGSMSKKGENWSYTYNADGMRTQKTNGTVTYNYIYNGGQLVQMTVSTLGEDDATSTDTLYFTYDTNGRPSTLTYNNDTVYYYVTNLQGDVVAMLDENGYMAAYYLYNAWGELVGGWNSPIGILNPLRYRGYVYDNETELYYLQSRYYNPEIGRFINADGYIATGQGFIGNNMFTYCANNPVLNCDPNGAFFFTALGAVTGFVGGMIAGALAGQSNEELLETAIQGAVGGAIGGAGVDTALLIIGSCGTALPAVALAGGVAFLAGGAGNAYTTYATSDGKASDAQMAASFVIGGVANLISLGTSMGSVASNAEGLFVAGMNQLTSNMTTGTIIATGASIATNVITSTYTPPSTSIPGEMGQNTSVTTPVGTGYAPSSSKQTGGAIISIGQNNSGIVIPTIGSNLRVR